MISNRTSLDQPEQRQEDLAGYSEVSWQVYSAGLLGRFTRQVYSAGLLGGGGRDHDHWLAVGAVVNRKRTACGCLATAS